MHITHHWWSANSLPILMKLLCCLLNALIFICHKLVLKRSHLHNFFLFLLLFLLLDLYHVLFELFVLLKSFLLLDQFSFLVLYLLLILLESLHFGRLSNIFTLYLLNSLFFFDLINSLMILNHVPQGFPVTPLKLSSFSWFSLKGPSWDQLMVIWLTSVLQSIFQLIFDILDHLTSRIHRYFTDEGLTIRIDKQVTRLWLWGLVSRAHRLLLVLSW